MIRKRSITMLVTSVLMITAISATAGTAYDNALANLRSAYYLVDNHSMDPQAAAAETAVKNEIRAARTDLRNAGINDYNESTDHGKELESVKDIKERLAKANVLLRTSHDEIANADESTADKKQLKQATIAHIDIALRNINKLIAAK